MNGAFQHGRGGPGGWWILHEPELHLEPDEPMIPDIAGWRLERMPELPESTFFALPPDWVCEVLSPSTERIDRNEKMPIYSSHGIGWVWLVDPVARILEMHILDEERRSREVRVHREDERVRAPPFESVEILPAALWAAPVRAG